MRHLANAGEPKEPAYAREEQLLHGMHERNWSRETLVSDCRGKEVEMVVMGEGSGEDNGVVASVESPATTQEPVKRVEKRLFHRSKIVEFSYLGWLSYKIKTIDKTSSEAFLVKSGTPSQPSSEHPSSALGLKTVYLFESELIAKLFPHVLNVI